MKRFLATGTLVLVGALGVGAPASLEARDEDPASPATTVHFRATSHLYARISPAVVGLKCRLGPRGRYFGTGVIIDPSGLVLTSVTVVPRGARDIRVFLTGGREARARLLLTDEKKEIALVEIEGVKQLVARGETLPYLKLGDSTRVRIGDPVYTLGNSFRSIELDHQICVASGIVSGRFRLKEKRSESTYVGSAIEMTAALNNGMDGGPLVNDDGEIIGLLSLNYSRNRWLGTAVPVNKLKPVIARHRGWFDDRYVASRCYLGIELEEIGREEVRVLRVAERGPASLGGLKAGDRLLEVGGSEVESIATFRSKFLEARAGKELRLKVRRGGQALDVTVVPWGRF
ncbi:MAG: S1C family serine protease [Planctomycetota bacterium]|nr:S1C family serine protease [Planctomycetota bacterium]